MAEPLFIKQEKLESLVEEGKVTFEDNVLTILAEKKSYDLAPAVKITGLLDGDDTAGLVGKAWTVAEIEQKGGEHYRDSVLLGETAQEDALAMLMACQIAKYIPERVLLGDFLFTVAANYEQARLSYLTGQELQKEQGRRVRPVEIVEDKNERLMVPGIRKEGCNAVEETEARLGSF